VQLEEPIRNIAQQFQEPLRGIARQFESETERQGANLQPFKNRSFLSVKVWEISIPPGLRDTHDSHKMLFGSVLLKGAEI
jgi:hypothetical protein